MQHQCEYECVTMRTNCAVRLYSQKLQRSFNDVLFNRLIHRVKEIRWQNRNILYMFDISDTTQHDLNVICYLYQPKTGPI